MPRTARTTTALLACSMLAHSASGQPAPPAEPQPVTPWAADLIVEAVADAPWIGRMSHHPDGSRIALGRVGPGSGTWYHVREMNTATGDVEERGSRTIPDPDSVAWDTEGSFAPAGSILVGGVHGVFAVDPAGEVTLAIPPGGWLSNPEDMRFDAQGNLVIANYGTRALVRWDRHTHESALLHYFSDGILQFDVASDGSFRVIDPAGGVRTISVEGDDLGVAGSFPCTGIAASPGGVWGEGVFVGDQRTGDLLRLRDDGSSEVLFAGVFTGVSPQPGRVLPPSVELTFSPGGVLYVGVPETGAIYRIAQDTCSRMDANRDGALTPADFNAWIWLFNRRDMRADIDHDGLLLPADFYAWVQGWYTCDRTPARPAHRLRAHTRR